LKLTKKSGIISRSPVIIPFSDRTGEKSVASVTTGRRSLSKRREITND